MKKTKTTIATIALILVLTVAATLITSVPVISAAKRDVVGFVSVSPNIVRLGDSVTVIAWIIPQPLSIGGSQPIYEEMYLVFTKPDKTTVTKGPFASYQEGTIFTMYTPDALGKWSAKLTWAGDEYNEGIESDPYEFTVQEEPIEPYPAAELPTDYWTRPINAENREWYQIAGQWLSGGTGAGYNASSTHYNPYSKAPETAHILWKYPYLIGGLIGGEWGGATYASAYYLTVYPLSMGGRIYYMWDDQINCIDMQTGEVLWVKPGPFGTRSGGLVGVPGPVLYGDKLVERPQSQIAPYLWAFNLTHMMKYDAYTGSVLATLNSPPGAFFGTTLFDPILGYAYTSMYGSMAGQLIKWDLWEGRRDPLALSATTMNFSSKIIWSKPMPPLAIWSISGDAIFFMMYDSNRTAAMDTKTGEILWDIEQDSINAVFGTSAYGKSFWPSYKDMSWHAYDLYTGNEVWTSEPAEYPWGSFWSYASGAAYGKVYGLCYDGHIYAYDAETGETAWKFYSGDTTETAYNTWPFWLQLAIADGKIYVGNGEHTPTPVMMRGSRLYSLNANTGEEIWSISFGGGGAKAIADGKLIACNVNDLTMYAFDKGQTSTTVTASPTVIANGASVLIQGTVLDQSPAQPGTPAIADEYMTEWMEYLHMQKPMPMDATGVKVTLDAIDPNGNFISIGTVTSDMSGMFKKMWTPEHEGEYTIIATFEGSESYYSSYAETAIGVDPAPSPPQPLEPEPSEAPLITTEMAIIVAAVIVAVAVIVGFWISRKRK